MIYVLDAGQSAPKSPEKTPVASFAAGLALSPDGQHVIFCSNRPEDPEAEPDSQSSADCAARP